MLVLASLTGQEIWLMDRVYLSIIYPSSLLLSAYQSVTYRLFSPDTRLHQSHPTPVSCHIVHWLETAPSDTQRASDMKGQTRRTPGYLLSKLTDLTSACWQSVLYHDFYILLNFFLVSTKYPTTTFPPRDYSSYPDETVSYSKIYPQLRARVNSNARYSYVGVLTFLGSIPNLNSQLTLWAFDFLYKIVNWIMTYYHIGPPCVLVATQTACYSKAITARKEVITVIPRNWFDGNHTCESLTRLMNSTRPEQKLEWPLRLNNQSRQNDRTVSLWALTEGIMQALPYSPMPLKVAWGGKLRVFLDTPKWSIPQCDDETGLQSHSFSKRYPQRTSGALMPAIPNPQCFPERQPPRNRRVLMQAVPCHQSFPERQPQRKPRAWMQPFQYYCYYASDPPRMQPIFAIQVSS